MIISGPGPGTAIRGLSGWLPAAAGHSAPETRRYRAPTARRQDNDRETVLVLCEQPQARP